MLRKIKVNFKIMTFSAAVTLLYLNPAVASPTLEPPQRMQHLDLAHLTFKAPLVVDDAYVKAHGSIIAGNFKGTLNSSAIKVTTSLPVTIQNSILMGPGDLISADRSQLTVSNTYGFGTNPNQYGAVKGRFIFATNAVSLLVYHCYSNTGGGIYIWGYTGNKTPDQTIKIFYNQIENVDGRPSDGQGGYQHNIFGTGTDKYMNAIQFNNVISVPGMQVAWNQIINQPYNSESEDNISIYETSGTPSSHLLVYDNYVQGAYDAVPGQFPQTYSGGGIITDGNALTSYVDIYNNQVVSSANYGIAIGAGVNVLVRQNRVVSSGYVINPANQQPTLIPLKDAGSYYNDSGVRGTPEQIAALNDEITDNYGCMVGRDSSDPTGNTAKLSNWGLWVPDQNDKGVTNTLCNTMPTLADEAKEYQTWLNKLQAINKTVGPTW